MRLTDVSIRALPVPERGQKIYYDNLVPPFAVRVSQGGSKTFLLIYGKDRRKTTIGRFPLMSLTDARTHAKRLLAERTLGKSIKLTVSFTTALQSFLGAKEQQLKPSSYYELKRTLNHFEFAKALDNITYEDVAKVIDGLSATPSEAAHAFKDIRSFFNWCVPRYLPHSPIMGMKPPSRYSPRQRLLSTEEFIAVWNAADQLRGYGKQVQLLFSTGQRANQIISLQNQWIDRANTIIRFPADVMKGNTDHTIPYNTLTAALIDDKQQRPTSYQGKMKLQLDKLSGVTDWVLHDARRFYASQMAALTVPLPTVEKLLAHQSGTFAGIVSVYQRYDWLKEMREAVQKYEQWLSSLVGAD